MNLVKSNHRATLTNEHLKELIRTGFANGLFRFLVISKSQKPTVILINDALLWFNYCRSVYPKLAFFTLFLLTLETDFAARWCFRFSADDSSIEQVRPPLHYSIYLRETCQYFMTLTTSRKS